MAPKKAKAVVVEEESKQDKPTLSQTSFAVKKTQPQEEQKEERRRSKTPKKEKPAPIEEEKEAPKSAAKAAKSKSSPHHSKITFSVVEPKSAIPASDKPVKDLGPLPKKPMQPHFAFQTERARELRAKDSTLAQTAATAKAAAEWKDMDEAARAPWLKKHDEALKLHEK